MQKNRLIRTLMDTEHVKGPEDSLNLQASIFLIFFDHCERNQLQ